AGIGIAYARSLGRGGVKELWPLPVVVFVGIEAWEQGEPVHLPSRSGQELRDPDSGHGGFDRSKWPTRVRLGLRVPSLQLASSTVEKEDEDLALFASKLRGNRRVRQGSQARRRPKSSRRAEKQPPRQQVLSRAARLVAVHVRVLHTRSAELPLRHLACAVPALISG